MLFELLIFAATILMPLAIGFALGHFRPASRNFRNALLATLPVCLPFFAWALWIALTEDLSCTTDPCENVMPLWAMALFAIGVLTGVTGFGVGLLGDTYARNRAKNAG